MLICLRLVITLSKAIIILKINKYYINLILIS